MTKTDVDFMYKAILLIDETMVVTRLSAPLEAYLRIKGDMYHPTVTDYTTIEDCTYYKKLIDTLISK